MVKEDWNPILKNLVRFVVIEQWRDKVWKQKVCWEQTFNYYCVWNSFEWSFNGETHSSFQSQFGKLWSDYANEIQVFIVLQWAGIEWM